MTRRHWGAAAAAAIFLAAVGPWPAWEGDFRGAPYYRATLRALRAAPVAPLGGRPLRVGVGAANLPIPGVAAAWPRHQLFATRLAPPGGENLQAGVIALDDGAHRLYLVSAELLLITPALVEATLTALHEDGVPVDRAWIYFGATHTHSGPGGLGDGLVEQAILGRYRPAFVQEVGRRIAAAVRQAGAALAPAEVGHVAVPVPAPLGNRLAPGGPVDPTLDILAFRAARGGPPLATILSYAAHPTTLGGEPRTLSGDYPGALVRALRGRTGAPALFFAGALGSMSVVRVDLRGPQGTERLGVLLADAAAAALPGIVYRREARVATLRFPLVLPRPQLRLGAWLALSPLLPSLLLPREPALHLAAVNDFVLVGVPGELSGEESLPWRAAGRRRGVEIVPTSLNGEYIGYIVPDARYGTAGYETRWGAAYGPRLAGYLRAVMEEAVARLVQPAER